MVTYRDGPYFMLVSEMSGLCMEVDTGLFGGVKEGLKIVTSKKDGKDQQLWYEDQHGVLRTKVSNLAIECLSKYRYFYSTSHSEYQYRALFG